MSWNNKIIWSEGMFLQPQHFQQHDRFLTNALEQRSKNLRPYSYGFTELRLDHEQLTVGKITLKSARGILPDGTPFSMPDEDDLPEPLDVPIDARNVLIVLALPMRREGIPDTENGHSVDSFARYRVLEIETADSNGQGQGQGQGQPALMQIGKLRMRLALKQHVASAYSTMGVAHVVERRVDNHNVTLDLNYIPPCLTLSGSFRLKGFVDELYGMLKTRGEALCHRLGQPGITGAAEISDFLMLQLISRAMPLLAHFSLTENLHPEELYRHLLQLAGETMLFATEIKQVPLFDPYIHDELQPTYDKIMATLRRHLAVVTDVHAVQIPLLERQYGIRTGSVPDPELIKSATFVLVVNAQVPAEALRNTFPSQAKMGPIEKIRDLINLQLPGIALRPMAVAPRQLPFLSGYTYFELDRGSELWKSLTSTGFALHVAGTFPDLVMEFWAIRR